VTNNIHISITLMLIFISAYINIDRLSDQLTSILIDWVIYATHPRKDGNDNIIANILFLNTVQVSDIVSRLW